MKQSLVYWMKSLLVVMLLMPNELIGHVTAKGADIPLERVKLPPGFKITVFTADVPNARSMVMSPDGTVFVGTRRAGKVYAVLDRNGDYRADEVVTIAKDLNMPNGVAFRNGSLYVAEVDRILRYDKIEKRIHSTPKPVLVSDKFPNDRHHGWKYIAIGPDEMLYVPVGAPCNICEKNDPRYEIFADGWLTRNKAWGRSVDIIVINDGSLLVSDDRAGVIYRITYGQ